MFAVYKAKILGGLIMDFTGLNDLIAMIIDWLDRYLDTPLPVDTIGAARDVCALAVERIILLIQEYQIFMGS